MEEKKHGLLAFGVKIPETVIIKTREGDDANCVKTDDLSANSVDDTTFRFIPPNAADHVLSSSLNNPSVEAALDLPALKM